MTLYGHSRGVKVVGHSSVNTGVSNCPQAPRHTIVGNTPSDPAIGKRQRQTAAGREKDGVKRVKAASKMGPRVASSGWRRA